MTELSPLALSQVPRFSTVGEALLSHAIFNSPFLFKKDKAVLEVSHIVQDTAMQFSSEPRLVLAMKCFYTLHNESRMWHLLNLGLYQEDSNPLEYLFYSHGPKHPSLTLIKKLVEIFPDSVNKRSRWFGRPHSQLPMVGWCYSQEEMDELYTVLAPNH